MCLDLLSQTAEAIQSTDYCGFHSLGENGENLLFYPQNDIVLKLVVFASGSSHLAIYCMFRITLVMFFPLKILFLE